MAPKVKPKLSGGSEWQECLKCHILIATRDLEKHSESFCLSLQGSNDHSDSTSFVLPSLETPKSRHGFFKDGVLCALVQESNKKVDEAVNYPKNICQDYILLSPSTMRMGKLCIGSHALVTDATNHHSVHVAWPSKVVSLGNVIFGKQTSAQYKPNDLVTVRPYQDPLLPITKLYVLPVYDKDYFLTEDFARYFVLHTVHSCVTAGTRIRCRYYGQTGQFIVIHVEGEDGSSVTCDDNDCHNPLDFESGTGESIASELEHLHLSSDGSCLDATADKTCSEIGICEVMSPVSSTPKKCHDTSFGDLLQDCERGSLANSLQPVFQNPKPFYIIVPTTCVVVRKPQSEGEAEKVSDCITYNSIGGLKKQLEVVRETVALAMEEQERLLRYGLHPPKGIVLFGPPGTGKSLIAQAIRGESRAHFVTVKGPEVYGRFYGDPEAKLKNIFKEAIERAPTIIFIDDIDNLCPKGDGVLTGVEKQVSSTLCSLLDGLPPSNVRPVLVVATTSKLDSLDLSLRQPGRLDREVEIGVPNAIDRAEILCKLLQTMKHNLQISELQDLADSAHGYTGADLATVCREAGLRCLDRHLKEGHIDDEQLVDQIYISLSDIAFAMKVVKPSAMKEITIEVPKVRWEDIGGMQHVKLKLKQAIEWPLKHPEAFRRLGITPPRGLLMYGPPGCSKTMVAKALATESRLNFIAIKGPELLNKWVGESEKAVREVFRKAKAASPSILFFDEIDALAPERGSSTGGSNVTDRVLTQLLVEMDGIEQLEGVTIVAATNRPDMIDKALLRPGRLDNIVYVPLPDRLTRQEIFQIQIKKMPVGKDVNIEALAEKTDNYSGAEIVAVCREAALLALQEDISAQTIYDRHFSRALEVTQPRTSSDRIRFYEDYSEKHIITK